MLVFRDQGMRARLAKLRDLGRGTWCDAPIAIASVSNALLMAPEGTALLFLEE